MPRSNQPEHFSRRPGRQTTTKSGVEEPVYSVVAMGGTFDVLHRGHRQLLRKAFSVGRRVMIGVTSDKFAHKLHKPHKVDPYAVRKRDLKKLLSRWHVLSRAEIVQLTEKYGPTVNTSSIEALVVSRRTIRTAYEINTRRNANGLKPLAIIPIELILADDRRPISSTRIRRGRIDREGRLLA
jgi:cytidyltransferase-like protein